MTKERHIRLGHGGGGRLTGDLVREVFLKCFGNPILNSLEDAARLLSGEGQAIAFTTDSFVVSPSFFPGGDIGRLSVAGTVNDLAVAGAIPKYLACAFIIEEGFPMEHLERIAQSMACTAQEAGVSIVTGDTKTVEKGRGDGVFITTSGIGLMRSDVHLSVKSIAVGDSVIVSGTLGDHALAVVKARGQFSLDFDMESDVAPLNAVIGEFLDAVPQTRFLRDPTRGGIAAVLGEISRGRSWSVALDEKAIPITREVRGFCEILGYDPLTLANEGKFLAVVPRDAVATALETLKKHPLGRNASLIGHIDATRPGSVLLKTQVGGTRLVQIPLGEDLPRIC